jgi:iron(III) transport system permease protein
LPTIYGMHGIILVFSLKFFPFVYLMTESALRNINRSFEEAAENLGCTRWQRFLQDHACRWCFRPPVRAPSCVLCCPLPISARRRSSGATFRTLSTIAYNQYTSEMGGPPTMAVSISMLMIVISMLAVFLQRYLIGKRRYAGSMTNLARAQSRCSGRRTRAGARPVLRHRGAGHLPIAVVIYTSFLQTKGPVFSGGFGLNSYARVIRRCPT